MKKKNQILLSVLLSTFCLFNLNKIYGCTNLLVGKNASTDGSTMISYSADSYNLYGELYHFPAANYPKGTMLKVYDWDSGKYLGEIEQAEKTYNVIGNMNEYQLTIAETTFGGREELINPNGILDYGSLIYITLQRAKTAKEAIKVMTDLVEKYGYYSGGESFSIGDPNEIWVLEMVGKGPNEKGAVWVAMRIPDDCITAHANQARIQNFPKNDPNNCLYSKDVISFAKKKGYFEGKDSEFSFTKAYAPLDFGALRFCEARVWSFFNRYGDINMEEYLSYVEGDKSQQPMPLYVKPKNKLSLENVIQMMRDHYEDTPLDWRYDFGAGPYNSPYRFAPLQWEVDSVEYCNERPIATQQTAFTFVGQMKSWIKYPIGGILWFGVDDAGQTVFTPMFSCMTEVPECFKGGNGDLYTFSWTSSFWINNWISNMVYYRYSQMHPDVVKVQEKLETKFQSEIPAVEKHAMELVSESKQTEAIQYLTNFSIAQAQYSFDEYKKLGEFLLIKYMDGIVRKEKDGVFERNEYGQPSSPIRTGYSKEFYEEIVKDAGEKYKVRP